MEIFESSETFVEIPIQYKVICFRVNHAFNTGPMSSGGSKISYPRTGYIKSLTDRGFYGIKLDQRLDYAVMLAKPHYDPQFAILEVDSRLIIQEDPAQIEFTEANILFTGSIDSFIIEIQKYATPEQLFDIYQSFFVKLYDYIDAKSNPGKRSEYFAKSLLSSIDQSKLNPEQKNIYDNTFEKIKEIGSAFMNRYFGI
jgi:hypothetical protein